MCVCAYRNVGVSVGKYWLQLVSPIAAAHANVDDDDNMQRSPVSGRRRSTSDLRKGMHAAHTRNNAAAAAICFNFPRVMTA